MGSLSSSEKEVVEQFIEYGTDKFGFDTGRALPLTLVFLGERDGVLIGAGDSEDEQFIESLLDEHGVPYKKDSSNNAFFISKSSSHLSRYNPTGSAKQTGKFLGYPDDAIEAYANRSDPLGDFSQLLEEKSNMSESKWSDKAFLIEYIPAPTEEGLQESLDCQKRYEKALRSASVDLSDAHNRRL